jgi:hypothetical protein
MAVALTDSCAGTDIGRLMSNIGGSYGAVCVHGTWPKAGSWLQFCCERSGSTMSASFVSYSFLLRAHVDCQEGTLNSFAQ